jgi:transposase
MSSHWVGVDIAKESFVVWVAGSSRPLGSFPNSAEGFEQLAAALAPLMEQQPGLPIHLVMEPTGGYEARLARFALQQGWLVSLVNPARVRRWAEGEGRRAKTDRQDARMLADYGTDKQPPAWQPLPEETSELDSLLRRRTDLEKMLRQERNRQESLGQRPHSAQAVPVSVERLIATLEEELARIQQAIKELMAEHAELKAEARWVDSVPGIGAKTVLPVLVLLKRFDTLTQGQGDAKGLVAYVGLDPQPFASGSSVHKPATISRMGDKELRSQIVMATLGGIRGNNPLRDFYKRLVDRGKPKMLALVAAARKMLVWAWAVFRRRSRFMPELHMA